MVIFYAPEENHFENIVRKDENARNEPFLFYPLSFSLAKRNCTACAAIKLLSTNAFNLDEAKILSSGQGLIA